ncbi:putative Mg2+ transporter-C (MgtC) family protein [Antricoccus suffuscus]|uniref:Putative Mg2+ transporter-C (MgtC) family protein n=1 Tax=Antricoccus suffuscus TaxID=1629062 RepID=A0A2T0ZY59_9ACTN|nr:MgtC/SapB family protein [Antricoccus suffuscus]PRZ41280.1 putative Mg2+ transporter-C (MgtC) family protein [Antricoccus suffuscus]
MSGSHVLASIGADGQGWKQVGELALAFLLSSAIGLERQIRGKSAGLRTQAIVGTASALIMLVSKYGFNDVLSPGAVVLDPSRVAAQIVTGIGFLGAGLIITRRGETRGLTTAASVWETAAIGMAAGAGLTVLALVVTCLHFIIVLLFTWLSRYLPGSGRATGHIRIRYRDGQGVLREILAACSKRGWVITGMMTDNDRWSDGLGEIVPGGPEHEDAGRADVAVVLHVAGAGMDDLTSTLGAVDGVVQVDRLTEDESE